LGAGSLVLLFAALLLASVVQGLSGLGFSLVAAPVITQVIPGSQSIGLVNLLAMVQNIWQVFREKGGIAWRQLGPLGLGLAVGVGLGLSAIALLPDNFRPLVVALSSLGSLVALVFWRPRATRAAAVLAGTWGGAVNTYAGVGGPPIASYMIRLGMDHSQFVRTLQVVFAALNLVSLPFLGIPSVEWWLIPCSIGVILAGASLGMLLRSRIPAPRAVRISEIAIAAVCIAAAARAVVELVVS
jgi:hypothetical protein